MEGSERNKKNKKETHCLCLLHNLFIFSFSSGVIRVVKLKERQRADAYISGSANNYKLNNKFNIARPRRPVILFIVHPLCRLLSWHVHVCVCVRGPWFVPPLTVYIRTRFLPFNEPTTMSMSFVRRPFYLLAIRSQSPQHTHTVTRNRPFVLIYTCQPPNSGSQ